MTTCPKCDFELPAGAVECPACGIVLSKYRERAEAPPAAPEAAPPPPPDDRNPYTPPDAPLVNTGGELYGGEPVGSTQGITSATLDALRKARPWLRFLVGYGFVALVLMVLGALAVLVGGVATDMGTEVGPLAMVYLFYALIGLVMLLPLWSSSRALRDLDSSDPSAVVESFMVHQATFWRRTGILTAITVGLILLLFVIGFLMAAASGVGG